MLVIKAFSRLPQLCLPLLLGCLSLSCQAEIVPGEYLTEGASGILTITAGSAGKLNFSLYARAEGSCSMRGEIIGGKATLRKSGMKQSCVMRFTQKNHAIEIEENGLGICEENYCEVASIPRQYFNPPGCSTSERSQARKEFKTSYDAKNYPAAMARLEPIVTNCSKILEPLELGWLHNDLALVQYKLQMPERCLATLKPWAEDAALPDNAIINNCEGCSDDYIKKYLSIIKATRTNLRMCKNTK